MDQSEQQFESKNEHGSPQEVFLTFLKLGLTSFGGPIAHIGYFRTEFVETKKWLNDSQFSQLLAISQFLPGPASSQLGFSIGLIRAGWPGALAAFIAFTLPSAVLLIAFASSLTYLSDPIGDAAIHGLKIVALAVVVHGLIGMSRNLCPDIPRRMIALFALLTLLVIGNSFAQLALVLLGAFAGVWLCKSSDQLTTQSLTASSLKIPYRVRTGYLFIAAFLLILLAVLLIPANEASLISVFSIIKAFYNAGALVFGGGHVVLPFLEESVVGSGWLSSEQFLAGYGASQAIPGPMFSFSAYLGAVLGASPEQGNFAGSMLFATIALVSVFLPGFLLITGVLPVWQQFSSSKLTQRAIAGVNAVVVGILAATVYDPIFTTAVTSVYDLIIGAAALALLMVRKSSPLTIVVFCVFASTSISLLL